MRKEMIVNDRRIGEGKPLFIMAECGVTCNYDVAVTKELIDVVHETGADAIKLIFWFPDEIMSDKLVTYTYETTSGKKTENMYEMLSRLRFDIQQWCEIKEYADKKGVILFSTVNSPTGIEYAQKLDLQAYKLSSWDYNYSGLYERIAKMGKPIFLDTGPVYPIDVIKVLQWIRDAGNDQVILIHCFHTENHHEMNMRSIPYMREAFHTPVGFSSPGRDDTMDIVAVSLGAVVLEKRLTLRRDFPGHHHYLSKEPREFEKYVLQMRDVQASLGEHDLRPSQGDLQERKKWFRHLVANQDIPQGMRLTADMLEAKRGEFGVSPEYTRFFIGRTTKKALHLNETLSWEDV